MGYFSEMALNKQEELGLPAEQVSAGNAFEDEETFDELPVPSASHSAASPTVETPSSPAFDADDGAEELAEMNGDDASEAADTDAEFTGALSRKAATWDGDLEDLAREMTPGGLNWMALTHLEEKDAYTPWTEILGPILEKVIKE